MKRVRVYPVYDDEWPGLDMPKRHIRMRIEIAVRLPTERETEMAQHSLHLDLLEQLGDE